MGIREDIKVMLARRAMTMTKVAQIMTSRGMKMSIKNLSNKLVNRSVRFEEVREIADILGYKIEFVEK
ncbi:LLM class flavin-dependent oxidoreductase [bacterium]|nr:LLM class flavin-dependent oxidoreductase [bacterium]